MNEVFENYINQILNEANNASVESAELKIAHLEGMFMALKLSNLIPETNYQILLNFTNDVKIKRGILLGSK